MQNTDGLEPRFKIEDAAERSGLSVFALRKAARTRQIEFFQIGNRYEFTDSAVRQFIDRNRQPVAA